MTAQPPKTSADVHPYDSVLGTLLTLPPEPISQLASPSQNTPIPESKINYSGNSRLRVLVVDDNRDAADSLSCLIRLLGNDARAVYDGSAAIQAALDSPPDIVFLDLALPRMDGFQVARRLLQEPTLASTIFVALTGYGREEDRLHAQEAGFHRFLLKPADMKQLEEILAFHKPLRF